MDLDRRYEDIYIPINPYYQRPYIIS